MTFCDVFFTFLTCNVIDDFAPDIFSILRYKNFFSRHLVGTEQDSTKLEGKYSLESTDPRESEIRAHLRP